MADPAQRWREYFAFEQPYPNQRDAIEAAIEVGEARGFLAMEGPCGTGKTMASLTAATALVRHGDYERVVVVTPVKQQRLQFIEDLRALNATLEEPMNGIALVGKRDLCPYGREGVFPEDVGVHDRCEDLREATAGLVDSDRETDDLPVADAAVGEQTEEIWWDPKRASELVKHARPDGAGQQRIGTELLSTAGAESPYPRTQPDAPAEMADGDGPLYCPFEADWYARNRGSPVDFSIGEEHVLTAEEYLPAATERGTCPHRVMGTLLESADVIVGNYNHLFDPKSRPLVESVLDGETFLVVDEAHRLEERVRDLLSDRLGRTTIQRARNDLATLLTRARESDDNRRQVRQELSTHDVPIDAVERARNFYDDLLAWLDDRIATHLDSEYGSQYRAGDPRETLPDQHLEIPLRDPESVEQDDLTAWAEAEGYTGDLFRSLSAVGAAVESTFDALGQERTPVCAAVGALAGRWWECDHASYLREIELEHAPKEPRSVGEPWQAQYTAGLVLFECMPGETLQEIFDGLGGGVLMSATLEPLDVFTEVAGLEALAEDRPVVERTYDLPFPETNRASYLVDATAFTARNRGDPGANRDPERWTPTRDEYAHVLRTLARSPGNVLLAMPNYREAGWAGEYLAEVVDKPVLVDESSSNEETERLKQRFFDGSGKVLVTSTRGTLTEGVDYDGEKLACCGVVGVPLVNIASPRVRAVQRAYGDAFGEANAFEYALTVPAVRRARQAIGRVIRGTEEVGVRALVGGRYVPGARHSVHPYLSPGEQSEFVRLTPEFLAQQLEQFWADRRPGAEH